MAELYPTDDYELIRHSKLKHMHSFINEITYRNFHLHSDFELLLVLTGEGHVRVRDTIYELKAKDSLIINQNEIHEIESSSEPFTILMIQFSRHFCADYFPDLRNTTFSSRFLTPESVSKKYTDFIDRILKFNQCYTAEGPLYHLSCIEHLICILQYLYANTDYVLINESQYQEGKKRSERLNRISSYIGSNYLYPIKLKDLADLEGISTTHMSHIFTQNFGVTFQQYLTSKRAEEAVRLSHNRKMSAVKISELSGFSDPKYLNKAFEQRFGCNYKDFIEKNIRPAEKRTKSVKEVFERILTEKESLRIIEKFTDSL